jgi:hypothetical protein
MIGLDAGQRRRAFDHVEAIHLLAFVGHAAARGEVLLVPHAAGTAGQEVGIEPDDHVRLVEVVDRIASCAARLHRRHPRAVARDRIVLVPPCLREGGQEGRHQLGKRRRRRWSGEEPDTRPLSRLLARGK